MKYLAPVPFGTLKRLQINKMERWKERTADLTIKLSSPISQMVHSCLTVTDRDGEGG